LVSELIGYISLMGKMMMNDELVIM